MATAITTCNCEHEYQDKKYGKGMRVHNETNKVPTTYRCTVCGKVK